MQVTSDPKTSADATFTLVSESMPWQLPVMVWPCAVYGLMPPHSLYSLTTSNQPFDFLRSVSLVSFTFSLMIQLDLVKTDQPTNRLNILRVPGLFLGYMFFGQLMPTKLPRRIEAHYATRNSQPSWYCHDKISQHSTEQILDQRMVLPREATY